MRTVEFECNGGKYRYRPWSAFRAVTEWGKITADLGEGVIDRLVLPGSLEMMIDDLRNGDGGGLEFTLRSVLALVGDEDLGVRVAYYLDGCQVEADCDGEWLPLYGSEDTVGETLETLGVDGVDLLLIAWHVVREGCLPLFARLRSSVVAQALTSQKASTATADPS